MASGRPFRPKGFRFLHIAFSLTLAAQLDQLRRTMFLILTLAVAVGAWWGLSAMASPFVKVAHPEKSHDITLRNPRNMQALPLRYATQVAAMPEARGVYYTDLENIECAGSGFSVTVNAWGGPGVREVLSQEGYSISQVKAWEQDPLALLTDSETASRCGWHMDMGISPKSFSGRPMELHVSGISHYKVGAGTAIAHYAYINRIGGVTKPYYVAEIYVRAADPRDNDALAARIEAVFAHNDPPVQAIPDTVNQNAWTRFGKVQYLLAFVMIAVFLCCALVLVSVMAHSASQRRAQMALLRVFGFPRAMLWTALLLEVLLILVIGTAFGLGLGSLSIHLIHRTLGGLFQDIASPPWVWVWLPPGLCLLLTASLVIPSIVVAKVRAIDCLDM